MKRAYLVLGGLVNENLAKKVLKDKEKSSIVVSVDAGLEVLDKLGILPNVIIGDFDTVSYDVLNKYIDNPDIIIERHNPIKDASDTELAIDTTVKLGYHEIIVLGGLGGRIDHSLANIYLLCTGLDRDIYIQIIDECNRVYAIDHSFKIKKSKQWGKYVSFYPMDGNIQDFSIKGVKYPLDKVVLDKYKNPTFTISNEIVDDEAVIEFLSGLLLVIESKDMIKDGI